MNPCMSRLKVIDDAVASSITSRIDLASMLRNADSPGGRLRGVHARGQVEVEDRGVGPSGEGASASSARSRCSPSRARGATRGFRSRSARRSCPLVAHLDRHGLERLLVEVEAGQAEVRGRSSSSCRAGARPGCPRPPGWAATRPRFQTLREDFRTPAILPRSNVVWSRKGRSRPRTTYCPSLRPVLLLAPGLDRQERLGRRHGKVLRPERARAPPTHVRDGRRSRGVAPHVETASEGLLLERVDEGAVRHGSRHQCEDDKREHRHRGAGAGKRFASG